jgi:hypothetical protein
MHRGMTRPPGHAPLIGFPHGGVLYLAVAAAIFVSARLIQFPSEEMTVHSSSERHARSACGTLAHSVSSASHFALPLPCGHGTCSIRSPARRPHETGGSEAGRAVKSAAGTGGGADSAGAGAALGASEIAGAVSDGGAVEATAGDVAGRCAVPGCVPSQAASAKGTSQRHREDCRPRSAARATNDISREYRGNAPDDARSAASGGWVALAGWTGREPSRWTSSSSCSCRHGRRNRHAHGAIRPRER